tara:strand:+ start:1431 stop:1637 length:207 start_codon:yes stop_codon:yes gene_type:complete
MVSEEAETVESQEIETESMTQESEDDEVLTDLDELEAEDLSPYLVWGVGIALLTSVSSDSGTGTATTN